jgi:hypothetical protein
VPVCLKCLLSQAHTRSRVRSRAHTHTHTHTVRRISVQMQWPVTVNSTQSVSMCLVSHVLTYLWLGRRAGKCCLNAVCYVTLNLTGRTFITTHTRACECMIAKPMNMDNLGYHMHLVLYFGVLIRSSVGRVSLHTYIHTESLRTANKKMDYRRNARYEVTVG